MSKSDQTAPSSAKMDGAEPSDRSLGGLGAQDRNLLGQDPTAAAEGEQGGPARDGNASTIFVALLAALAEAALVAVAYRYNLALHWILLLHVLVVTALGLWVRILGRQDRDASHALLLLLSTLAVGPLGALGAAIATAGSALGREDQHLLEAWYDRISHSTQVEKVSQHCDMVAVGRTMDLAAQPPRSFSDVLQNGSLTAKQNALGLIARRFHPDYLPALQAALKSDLPVIRVQAAAVAAHVRVELRDELHRLIAEADLDELVDSSIEPRTAFLLAASIERCTKSGLLDEKDRLAGVTAQETLYDRALRQLDARGSAADGLAALLSADVASRPATQRDDGSSFQRQQQNNELSRLYEALLLRRGRYGAFRSLRKDLPMERPSLWCIRPWPGSRRRGTAGPASGGARS